MSVTTEAPIAVGISLASNATPQQVAAAIDLINRIFGVQAAPGVTPAAAAAAAPQQDTTVIAGTTGTLLDSTGLPWDERIHSSAKSQTGKKVWTKRKGVDDATFNSVSAQLRATLAATGTAALPTAPALPGAAAPSLPALPAQAGPIVPALPTTAPTVYQNFVAYIGTQLQGPTNPAGRLTSDWVDQVIANHGVAGGIANLALREDLIPAIEAQIRQALAG